MKKCLIDYMYYPVRATMDDGEIIQGNVVSYANALEHDLERDTFTIDMAETFIVISEDEIAEIEIIGERKLPDGMEHFFD